MKRMKRKVLHEYYTHFRIFTSALRETGTRDFAAASGVRVSHWEKSGQFSTSCNEDVKWAARHLPRCATEYLQRTSNTPSNWVAHRIHPNAESLHWEDYTSNSFHIEWDMIMVTVFLSILNQMEFHLVQNWKENCHHNHIPFNVKGNEIIGFSVYIAVVKEANKLNMRRSSGKKKHYTTKSYIILTGINMW